MIDLFREGGFPMGWLLAFGLTTLAFAARFAWIPVRRMLRMTFVLAGVLSDQAMACRIVPFGIKGSNPGSY